LLASDGHNVFFEQDSIIAGDLNADLPYITPCSRNEIPLRNDPRFRWITTDTDYTNVLGNKAYDRYAKKSLCDS